MKRIKANRLWIHRAAWGAVLLLMGLLLGACGPPGATQAGPAGIIGDGNGGGNGGGTEPEVLPPLPADCLIVDSAGTITRFDRTQAGCDITEFAIPREKGGTIITAIGDFVFRGDGTSSKLTKLSIPDSVKTIGDSTFFDNDLSSVSISNGVETIKHAAFRGNKLTKLVIPNSVTTIGESAFYDNQLTSLTLSNTLINIGFGAFRSNQLTSLSIPNSVKTIEGTAFDSNQLSSVTIPNSVTSIEGYSFGNNPGLVTIVIDPNSALNLDSTAFPNNFSGAFNQQATQAGTWTWAGSAWTFAP